MPVLLSHKYSLVSFLILRRPLTNINIFFALSLSTYMYGLSFKMHSWQTKGVAKNTKGENRGCSKFCRHHYPASMYVYTRGSFPRSMFVCFLSVSYMYTLSLSFYNCALFFVLYIIHASLYFAQTRSSLQERFKCFDALILARKLDSCWMLIFLNNVLKVCMQTTYLLPSSVLYFI